MASFDALIPYIKKSEGGISNDPDDNAATYPSPWMWTDPRTGITAPAHTNRGVIFPTFKNLAPVLGYAVTKENFLNMPDDIWFKIFKYGFWDRMKGDLIKSNGIAYIFTNMAWGSGPGAWSIEAGAKDIIQDFIKQKYGVWIDSDSKMVAFVNGIKDEAAFINGLVDYRLAWLSQHPDWNKYKSGWTRREEELRKMALQVLSSKKKLSSSPGSL
jgi:lysozyme family protein